MIAGERESVAEFTLKAVDARITLYVQTFLGLSAAEADATRLRLYSRHGTTPMIERFIVM